MNAPLDPQRARRVMMTLVEARIDAATVDELERARAMLDRLRAESHADPDSIVALQLISALEQLLYVERQLRDDGIERQILRMLAARPGDANG